MNATKTPAETALSLTRDDNVTLAELARHFGESEAFVGGLIEAVTGDDAFRDAEPEPNEAERQDYQRGFRHGQALVEAEAEAEGWEECYAIAAAEAAQAREPLPALDSDLPW
jgi:hypothetical protein